MPSVHYEIVLKGWLDGFEPHKVKTDLAALFSLSGEKVEEILSATRTVLKSDITREVADKYIARLAAIGISVVVEEMKEVSSLSLNAIENNPGAEISSVESPAAAELGAPSSSGFYEKKHYAFQFTGAGFEYFKIWIVNILLTILTLGIYSAWAKVRNLQYFYGNTYLNKFTFEYTAKPLQILKGRIIATLFLIAYSILANLSPVMALVLSLVLIIATPLIVVLSLRFSARCTRYRNIAFRFNGGIGGAWMAFIVWPILALCSFGLLLPFAWRKQTQYVIANHSYGDAEFNFKVGVTDYYIMIGKIIGGSLIFFVFFCLFVGNPVDLMDYPAALMGRIGPLVVIYMAFYFIIGAYFAVTMANIQFNNTALLKPKSTVVPHRFSADWQVVDYAQLLMFNTLLIIITLGLFIPFAKIRTAAYKAENTSFVASSDLDGFVAGVREQSNSLAEGVNDLFAMDISI
jgi:uncharacterized membrane protein YjgN (DUF898 family)